MVKIKFMDPEYLWREEKKKGKLYKLKNVKKITRHIREKYGVQLSEELLYEKNYILLDYLEKAVSSIGVDEKLDECWESIKCKQKLTELCYLKYAVDELKVLLSNPEEYYIDLLSTIYMGLLYNDTSQDYFAMKLCIKDIEKQYGKPTKEQKEQIKDFNNKRETIKSVWRRESNKGKKIINGEEVPACKRNVNATRAYYPIPVKMNDSNEILSLRGGCFWYHYTMINLKNFGIFDLQTEIKNYRRYSFMRMYKIYEALKDTSVENLLLMEYSLGIGLANQIYEYFYELNTKEEVDTISDLIQELAEIYPIFIRKKVVDIICKRIELKEELAKCSETISLLVEVVNKIVNDVFFDVLELWWYEYFLYGDKAQDEYNHPFIHQLGFKMNQCMRNYFSFDKAYEDSLKVCGTYDWRGVSNIDDCFKTILNNYFVEKQYKKKLIFELSDYLDIELDKMGINKIGKDILRRVKKDFINTKVEGEQIDVYELFYKRIETEFFKLRKKDKKDFYDREVKIGKSLNATHIYAMLQYKIIETLLLSLKG